MSHIYSSSRRPKREYNQSWNHIPAAPGVYQISCTQNGKRYFGATQNLKQRWSSIATSLSNGIHPTPSFQADYDQFGLDAFEFDIIRICETMTPKQRKELEKAFIETENPEYNSVNVTESHPNFTQWRTNQSKGQTGIKRRPYRYTKPNPGMTGKRHSPASIEKMREARRRQPTNHSNTIN
jgi:group I intron endonuclease